MRTLFIRQMTRVTSLMLAVISAAAAAQASSSNASTERAGLSSAQMRADIAAFRTEFLALDSSYSPAAREQVTKRLQQLEQNADHASQAGFELELARLVALADNGHTAAIAGPRSRHFNRVPIRLTPFVDEWRVLRATNEETDLLGAKLVAIDGHRLADLRAAARTLAGGTPAWRDRNASYLFESPEQLHALGLAARSSDATYSFVGIDGQKVERRLTGEAPNLNRARANADRWLYPELLPTEEGRWHALLDPSKTPWSLADANAPFRSRSDPEIDAVVVQLRQTTDSPDHSIRDFLREMTQKIQAEHPRNLVVDMRLNGGGDLNTARDFMKSLPTLVPGRIFVLTSPWTFSAAISSVGYLKQSAPNRVTIVMPPSCRIPSRCRLSRRRSPHPGRSARIGRGAIRGWRRWQGRLGKGSRGVRE